MSLEEVEKLLKNKIGLHPESVGDTVIASAVNRRMAACRVDRVGEYCDHVKHSRAELHELVETVVIPETWFFRDQKPFEAVARVAQQRRGNVSGKRPLRVLSIPCSTGEEPYSIAITLHHSGLPLDHFRVDGVDVSRRALEYARAASYGSHSFRGHQDPEVITRYFTQQETRFVVDARITDRVDYYEGNILDSAFNPRDGQYDVIFCRNLLIYFDTATRKRACANLQRILNQDGLLFVGHAEYGCVPDSLFHAEAWCDTYAFRRGPSPEAHGAPKQPVRAAFSGKQTPPGNTKKTTAQQPKPAPRPTPAARPTPAEPPEADELELAHQLADMGRLAEAAEICARFLASGERRAQAYFLQGLIDNARGETEKAEQNLRKTIYLEPKHFEAMIHLALLLDHQGDHAGAELLRRRANRIGPEQAASG